MEFWCHVCKRETEVSTSKVCNSCQKNFVEEIDLAEQHPRNFVPYNSNSRGRLVTELILMPTIRSFRQSNTANEIDTSLDALIHQLMLNDPNRYGPPPASKNSIMGLNEINITSEIIRNRGALHRGVDEFGQKIDVEKFTIECSICKEEFDVGDQAVDMPCLHLFHKVCIISWLEAHNNCPVCRYEFPTDDPDYEARRLSK
ncbi:hypothetical protein SteCoe_12344 [Stentor coeruleus]|uniref:RING-type E3 ubiquitin transferase n=1 Tax=Stentor coeruleus TaxID=5963 RepID=A0A1R2CB15_9CILI|nr:hypothetical protein SteCoe_12344 [Stentor coeruleus]